MAQPTVVEKIAEIIGNGKYADSNIFRDFEGDENHRQLSAFVLPMPSDFKVS